MLGNCHHKYSSIHVVVQTKFGDRIMDVRTIAMPGLLSLLMLVGTTVGDELNIRYGEAAQQKLDVYSAVGGSDSATQPVVIWVHGGGWRNGDKDNRSGINLCKTWVKSGVVMVNLNYRLTPDVMHPAHVEDVASGIAWVHKNIAKHGGDPKKVYLLGHSAGAHLVALVATAPEYLKVHKLSPRQAIAGVLAIDTASYDLASTRTLVVRKMIRDAFGDEPKTLANASPFQQAKQNREACPPFIIAVVKQRPEALRESRALNEVLPNSQLIEMDYPKSGQLKAHAEIALDMLDINNKMTQQLLSFVKGEVVRK
jgi:arylformamidase